jgi:hypothetical protein
MKKNKEPTPQIGSRNQTPNEFQNQKIPDNYWDEREKNNFIRDNNSQKPPSSQGNKPFQSLSFRNNNGTPQTQNQNMNNYQSENYINNNQNNNMIQNQNQNQHLINRGRTPIMDPMINVNNNSGRQTPFVIRENINNKFIYKQQG